MQRKVEFYSIKFSFLPMMSSTKSDDVLKSKFIKVLNDTDFPTDAYEVKFYESNESSVTIELIENEDEHLFGIIAKVEDLKNGPLKRIKEKKSKEVLDSHLDSLDFTLENYTYFYLCKETLYCSVISNYSAPRFQKHFQEFLNKHMDMSFIQELKVQIVLDEKIDRKLKTVQKLSQLDMTFDDTSSLGREILELSNAFAMSQDSLRRARVNIDLKLLPISENTRGIFRKLKDKNKGFEKFEVTGVDDEDDVITMEFIERILVKSVDINIDDTQLITLEAIGEIKKALKGSLTVI